MLAYFERFVKYSRLQRDLEKYILAHHPKNTADIERLIKEYNYKSTGIWL